MRLKIGKKVAVLRFDLKKNQDKFEVGKIVGIMEYEDGVKGVAVEFSDEKIEIYNEFELFKKWDKEYEK